MASDQNHPQSGAQNGVARSLSWRQVAALGAVYVIWGSTYLAIRFAIETLPGFSMSGLRFLLAGGVLYLWARLRGAAPPRWVEWRSGLVIGAFLLLGGNGGVVWAEHRLQSGMAALIVASEPLWVVLLLCVWPRSERPRPAVLFAMLLGFVGVVLLLSPAVDGSVGTAMALHLPSALMVMLAAVSWAIGSLYARRAAQPKSPVLATAMQMLSGGFLLSLAGVVAGEWQSFEPQQTSLLSVMSFLYLVVFGALLAFSCYSWLVRTTEPTLVATYAYVNPMVAVFLGWLLAGEAVGWRTLPAAGLIIGSVVLVGWLSRSKRRSASP